MTRGKNKIKCETIDDSTIDMYMSIDNGELCWMCKCCFGIVVFFAFIVFVLWFVSL